MVSGETEGTRTAVITTPAGTGVHAIVCFLRGNGLIAASGADIAWLPVFQHVSAIGRIWLPVIAVVVRPVASVVRIFLPVR